MTLIKLLLSDSGEWQIFFSAEFFTVKYFLAPGRSHFFRQLSLFSGLFSAPQFRGWPPELLRWKKVLCACTVFSSKRSSTFHFALCGCDNNNNSLDLLFFVLVFSREKLLVGNFFLGVFQFTQFEKYHYRKSDPDFCDGRKGGRGVGGIAYWLDIQCTFKGIKHFVLQNNIAASIFIKKLNLFYMIANYQKFIPNFLGSNMTNICRHIC